MFSSNVIQLTVDGSDAFPRYYFKLSNMLSEIYLWASERGQFKDSRITGIEHEEVTVALWSMAFARLYQT